MNLSRSDLLRMARCGAADGHDDDWHAQVTTGQHRLREMRDVAEAERADLRRIEEQFEPIKKHD